MKWKEGRNKGVELNEEKTKKTKENTNRIRQYKKNHTEGTGRVKMNLTVLA